MGLHLLSPSPSTVVDINLFGFSEKWLEGLLRITSAILGGVSKELEICDKYGLNKSCKNACVVVAATKQAPRQDRKSKAPIQHTQN